MSECVDDALGFLGACAVVAAGVVAMVLFIAGISMAKWHSDRFSNVGYLTVLRHDVGDELFMVCVDVLNGEPQNCLRASELRAYARAVNATRTRKAEK